MHWIATDYNRSSWHNPHVAHDLYISMSSVERGTPQDLCEVEPHELWTKDVPASWSAVRH